VERSVNRTKILTSNPFPLIIIFSLSLLVVFISYKTFTDAKLFFQNNSEENKTLAKDLIQVEVLNGCGKNGVADELTGLLRKNNFDVVNTGNYKTFDVSYSIVIDRSGSLQNAVKLADLLKIDHKNVIEQVNKNYFLDVTLIVGKDYREFTSNQR